MGLLQYTSNEMFSSTELVRKSKNIFDKLNKEEIEKAIILRDGKPGIILLDFNFYEKIMTEYLTLKQQTNKANGSIKAATIKQKAEINKEIDLDNNSIIIKENEIDNLEFSFNSDLTKDKEEPLKEFWD
jgi:protein tyrosine/serine phosphatase